MRTGEGGNLAATGHWGAHSPAAWIRSPALGMANLALALLMLQRTGYAFAYDAATVLIVKIRHEIDPRPLAGDWFLSLPKAYHPEFVALFAGLGRHVPLELLFLLGQVLTFGLLAHALRRFAGLLAPGIRGVFPLSCALLVAWGSTGLGQNHLLPAHFTAAGISGALAFLGLSYAVEGRAAAAAAWIGVATILHFQIGLISIAYAAGALLGLRGRGRLPIGGVLIYLGLAAVSLIPTLRLRSQIPRLLSDTDYVRLVAIIRNPHHYVPSSWGPEAWIRYIMPFTLAVPAWRASPLRGRKGALAGIGIAMVLLCVIGTVFVEIIPVREVVQLQLYRVTAFGGAVAAVLAAAFLIERMRGANGVSRILAAVLAAGLGIRLMWLCVCFLLGTGGRSKGFAGTVAIAIGGVLAAGAVLGGVGLHPFLALAIPWRQIAASRWIAFAVTAGVILLVKREERLAFATLAGLTVAAIWNVASAGWDDRIKLTVAASWPAEEEDWVSACRWVATETPEGARFITPPYRDGFHAFAERPEVADWKSNPFTDDGLVEWEKRLEDLTGGRPLDCSGWAQCPPRLEEGYASLTTSALEGLARKYEAWGCLTETEVAGLDELHRVGRVRVYAF